MSNNPNQYFPSNEADTDMLTGALNKASLANVVEQMTANNQAHAFILLDLDGFRKLNSKLGHDSGNQLLVNVVSSLRIKKRKNEMHHF